MSQADPLLAELWAADEPPERDAQFLLSVMAGIERRRFWTGVASLVPVTAAASAILWAFAPMIKSGAEHWVGVAGQPALLAGAAALTMAAWLWSVVSEQPAIAPA